MKRTYSTLTQTVTRPTPTRRRPIPSSIPSLREFLAGEAERSALPEGVIDLGGQPDLPPYMESVVGAGRKVFIQSYGCAMNEADSDVVRAVLVGSGFQLCDSDGDADVVLLNTCAIRERAEEKVWKRLEDLRAKKMCVGYSICTDVIQLLKRCFRGGLTVGVLGCMAERLKTSLLEASGGSMVDLVVGPDGYKTLPQLLHVIGAGNHRQAINTMLSADETYADIAPVRRDANRVSAYVSIMRGCNNMCSFCIVPHTRGRERSRPLESIVDEVTRLSEQGYR
jgi:tRNA-2-methylthio-N6-dimethylallyladenosine synthase